MSKQGKNFRKRQATAARRAAQMVRIDPNICPVYDPPQAVQEPAKRPEPAKRVPFKHWHVLTGLRGCYMPDSNSVHATRESAVETAAEEFERIADDAWQDEDATEKSVAAENVKHSDTFYTFNGGSSSVEVTKCTLADCYTAAVRKLTDAEIAARLTR